MPEEASQQEMVHVFDDVAWSSSSQERPPFVTGNRYVLDGQLCTWMGSNVDVYSPIAVKDSDDRIRIGTQAMMTAEQAVLAVKKAGEAYGYGTGYWPQCGARKRIEAVHCLAEGMKQKRNEIANLLVWEICKPLPDAQKEVDRTIAYIHDTLEEYKNLENTSSSFATTQGVISQQRRAPVGITLVLAPANYPLNESFTTLIPSVLMGNTAVFKLPRTGYLSLTPCLELFATCFPPNVINTIHGSGRDTMPAVMQTGRIDQLAFIGTKVAANALIKEHPAPHRLHLVLGLDAKNPGIVMPSVDIDTAISECVLGSLSFNGQRCTALKILFVHEDLATNFVSRLADAVDALPIGLPWNKNVAITPLLEEDKPNYLREVIADAVRHGANIVNKRGNQFDHQVASPTVLYPVNQSMRVYREEQFGPIVPIVPFREISEIVDYLTKSTFGQQASVFGNDSAQIARLTDILIHQVARVNINSQCQRGPDNLPFGGRRDSAANTLSIRDALYAFSIPCLVATKSTSANKTLLEKVVQGGNSNYLRLDHIF